MDKLDNLDFIKDSIIKLENKNKELLETCNNLQKKIDEMFKDITFNDAVDKRVERIANHLYLRTCGKNPILF